MSETPPADQAPEPGKGKEPFATLVPHATEQGGLRASYIGEAPRNEEGSEFAARNLVGLLNELGAGWSVPVKPSGREEGVDFVARDGTNELRLQVTRVPYDQAFWKELRRSQVVARDVDVRRAAAELSQAIQAKSDSLETGVKLTLTLLLDARYSPAHALRETLEVFDAEYADACRECGFAEVWIFGVLRIDRLLPGPLQD